MRFFSPPEKPTFSGRFSISGSILSSFAFSRTSRRKSGVESSACPARLAHSVHRRAQEGHGGDARNLHGVLKGEEHAGGGALGRVHGKQVLTLPGDRARGDLVVVLAGQHISERRLAGAVRPHDGVHLAGRQREVEAFEDLAAIDIDVKVLDLKHYDSSLILWH